ncbi:MAG: FKBP-type peptidyl-prolyl cis-trans isomerase [Gammaproteobacteria bacterium]|nr:FKBP-type peptidyl-prolyl cis-trans isomerase [Gammaproteobacteria bacterium]
MTSSAPPRGRTPLIISAAAAGALFIGALCAQTPPPSSSTGAAATGASPGKKAAGGAGAATGAPSEKSAVSYSIGVTMGDQLRTGAIKPEDLNIERLSQGVRDGLSGKVKPSDQDRERITKLVRSAHEAAGEANHRAAAKFLAENEHKPGVTTTASGLQYKVLEPGTGDSPKATDEVTVNYRGTLIDGTEFDSSYKRGQPASFQLNRVIPGWSEGLQLMKPGAKYQLFVPPQLAYDLRSPPGSPIPPGAMLIFEVELMSVKPPQAATPPLPSGAQPGTSPQPSSPQPSSPQPPKK